MKTPYIALISREDIVRWLQSTLGPDAEIAAADPSTPERALQLADATGASVAFVLFTPADGLNSARLVERLLSAKPYLTVVSVAESRDDRLMLAAMRAGARDYLTVGSDPVEVQGTISRLQEKVPTKSNASQGRLFSVLCGRPGADSATLAVHLALALRERTEADRRILLLDLGMPAADTLLYLDMKPAYTFFDALRSVRRFDETLIKSAFAQHSSGLSVLPMAEDIPGQQVNAPLNDALVLIGILKSHFDVIVANLGGMPHSDFLAQMVDRSERAVLLAEQSIASINASRRLLDFLVDRGEDPTSLELVVDRHLPKLELGAEKIAEVLSLPLLATLPAHGLERLGAMNAGYSVFEYAPNSPYSRALKRLATELFIGERVDLARHGGGLRKRLFGGLGKRS